MINAIAKRRLAFHKPDGGFLTVVPGEFCSLPDYVEKDPMYRWAVQDGVLAVSQQVIVKGENLPPDSPSVETAAADDEGETKTAAKKPPVRKAKK